MELVRFIEINKFDKSGMLFIIDFNSLYANVPVKDAIHLILRAFVQIQNVIPNAHLVVELLDLVLSKSLMQLNLDTNVAPTLANIY